MELGKIHLNLKTLLLTTMMFKWGILCTATSDKCLSAPCQNGATCVDTMEDYACICAKDGVRYMGKHCDQLYDACSFALCDNCLSTPGSAEYHCICPEGLSGDNCTEEVDECLSNPCSAPRSLCVDQLNGYFCRCPEGYGGYDCRTHVTDCVDKPCGNNGTCLLRPEGFECQCAPGYEGSTCEDNVNECASEPCQNGAICLDGIAEFQCFCVPGFQGYNCEIDINECASRPCENNATCINEKDHYECECLDGFAGVNCEVEIDECESTPCRNGATCHNLIGMYSCECVPGFDGIDCEIDLDECESQPCQNGAICHDMVNSYACDCTDTGFEGDHCEVDIPECESNPCQHGATCQEQVKGYICNCWPGYEGTNCEVDIDECAEQPCENGGECFERSDPSHWEMDWELSFADASGYICQCQPGFAGENCSVNINECESEPCQNGGACLDQVNGYTCTCTPGFLGLQCELNINECESQPCQNGGWCEDGRASYTCHCPNPEPGELPWGGEHCHIRLHGCIEHQCQNGATCSPWLDGEEHVHTCLCPHGFYDQHCSTRTTFSFSSPGLIHLELQLEERERREVEHLNHHGIGVQLRFRTTLPNMLLFFRGDEENYLLLEIVNGGLYAKAFSEDSELHVTFSELVSDGDWRDAHVILDDQGLVLIVKGPGCDRDGCKVIDDGADEPRFEPSSAFSHVYVGGVPAELLDITVAKTSFIGCMEDLMIDSKAILPQSLPDNQEVELGCSKTTWCEPDPCSSHGQCVDMWTSYYCECHRPYYGDSCSEEYASWTYNHENILSFSAYEINKNHGSTFNVSFFLRSLKPNGLLLQLRRPSQQNEGEVYFSIYLGMGRVFVSSLSSSIPLTAPIFVTTGEKQFLHVVVQQNKVIFEHAGLRYSIGKIPEVNISEGDWVYVGGLPELWSSDKWGGHYKGCLQDLRLGSVHLEMGQWKYSNQEDVYISNSNENIKEGCISDDTCKTKPCHNGGKCTISFNDFTCSCPEEYKGKTCETRVWCVSGPCVNGGHCVDLPDGYECVYNATFENNAVQYSAGGSLAEPVSNIYIEFRTRSENAVLLRAARGGDMLMVGVLDSSVRLEIQLGNTVEALILSGLRRVDDGQWHRVNISMPDQKRKVSPWVITVDGITDTSSSPEVTGRLYFLNHKSTTLAIAQSFTGCMGAVRIGGVYLPFVDDYRAPQPSQFHLVGKPKIHLGCTSTPVCDSDPCLNGGTCQDLFNKFGCVCDSGWEGEQCERDTDDCVSQPCIHGSCMDYLAGFECQCHPGYVGRLCDEDIDECEHHACLHGGTCQDGPNTYTCVCPHDYSGPLCQWRYPPEQCGRDVLCLNDGICHDGLWGANCTCMPGFTGIRCEMEINECESNPCRNGGSCLDHFNMFVCECPSGFSGPTCDTNKLAHKQGVPWLLVAIPLLCLCVLIVIIGLTFMVMTARKKRQSEGAYSPSAQELAGARLEMGSMLKVPPEERLI
ncbi:protein crumbs homolog 2a [Boleophthalmus pectinirostris]|uniref:protein crumbs homolog 2a n=1 Tax=Boleophthalmus pectinirostris TaxID=150288 RepID=UPI000A1C6D0D|nr:protein crumbs homolog 2a [Boleophthalmus pectinirostris]